MARMRSIGSFSCVAVLWLLVAVVSGESLVASSIRNSLVAGGNTYGNNILATLSVVNPMGITFSPLTNELYINQYGGADYGHNVIRKVDSKSGIITQVADIPFLSLSYFQIQFAEKSEEIIYFLGSSFSSLYGFLVRYDLTSGSYVKYDNISPRCVIEHNGKLYVGHNNAGNITLLDLTSGISQTLASSDSIRPSQFAIYENDLYFGDDKTYQVKKMSLATNQVTTVACNGNYGYSGDGGNATLAECGPVTGITIDSNGNLFLSDFGNERIRMVNLKTGIITTVLEKTTAMYLLVDKTNAVYINLYGNRIIKLTISGNGAVSTSVVAGNGDKSFYGYSDNLPANLVSLYTDIIPVVQPLTNDIYISAPYKYLQTIRKSDNNIVRNIKVPIKGIGADPYSNDIYYGERGFLKKMSHVDGTISIIAGTTAYNNTSAKIALNSISVNGMAFYKDDLYYSDSSTIQKIDGKIGIVTVVVNPRTVSITPNGVAFAGKDSGDLLIADTNNFVIRKLSQDGTLSVIAGVLEKRDYNGDNIPATEAHLFYPKDVAYSELSNEIFIAEFSRIRKISSNGIITTIAGSSSTGFNSSATLSVDSLINQPECIFLNGNDLYLCDTLNNLLRKIDQNGLISTVAGNGGNEAEDFKGSKLPTETAIGQVRSAVIDPLSGDIFIASTFVIYRILATTKKIITFAGKPDSESFNGENFPLNQMRFSKINRLLIKDNKLFISQGSRIMKVALDKDSNQIPETISGSNGDGNLATEARVEIIEGQIKITKSGDIYFSEQEGLRIRKISKQTSIITTILGSGGDPYYYKQFELNVLATRTMARVSDFDVDERTGILYFTEKHTVKMIDSLGYVRLVAGGEESGLVPIGDDGPAINATFSSPNGVLVLSNNVLIADTGNNRIRKINLNSNIISTIAGNGNLGYSSNTQNASSIPINSPKYLSLSNDNEIYYSNLFETGSIISKFTPYCNEKYSIVDGLNCAPTCFGSVNGCLFGNCTQIDTCVCFAGYSGLKCENVISSPKVSNSFRLSEGHGAVYYQEEGLLMSCFIVLFILNFISIWI